MMTAYYVTSTLSSATDLAIRAVTYEIRITMVSFYSFSASGVVFTVNRHETSTLSGGTAIDVVPFHQSSPAASTTGMVGSSLSFSGTNRVCGSTYLPPGQNSSVSGATVIRTTPGSTAQIQSPLTLTVTPGSVLHVGSSLGTQIGCQVYFEELRLAGSY